MNPIDFEGQRSKVKVTMDIIIWRQACEHDRE